MSGGARGGLHLLRLARTLEPGARRPGHGFGRGIRHDDIRGHGRRLQERTREITVRQLQRPGVLGIDPRLILVFELGAPVDQDEFRRSGLRVLDGSDRHVVIAFSDDPAMAAFQERLQALQAGPPEGQKAEPYAGFFDAIDDLRMLEPADRISPELEAALRSSGPDDVLRLDVAVLAPR